MKPIPFATKILTCISYVTIFLAFATIFYGAYLLLWPYNGYEVTNPALILNENHQIAQGEAIRYELDSCLDKTRQITIQTHLENGEIIAYVPKEINRQAGCRTKISETFVVPEYTPPGPDYKLVFDVHVKINQLRTETFSFETEPFEVTNDTTNN